MNKEKSERTKVGAYSLVSLLLPGSTEAYVGPEEKIADSLYKWEKWSQVNTSPSNRDLRMIFKVFEKDFSCTKLSKQNAMRSN